MELTDPVGFAGMPMSGQIRGHGEDHELVILEGTSGTLQFFGKDEARELFSQLARECLLRHLTFLDATAEQVDEPFVLHGFGRQKAVFDVQANSASHDIDEYYIDPHLLSFFDRTCFLSPDRIEPYYLDMKRSTPH